MRILLDSCVRGGAAGPLTATGHDVVRVSDWSGDPGDAEVLAAAVGENRVLITLDKDFGELAVVRGQAHAGIVRLVGFSGRRQGEACRAVLERYGGVLARGGIVTASPGRVRVREPD